MIGSRRKARRIVARRVQVRHDSRRVRVLSSRTNGAGLRTLSCLFLFVTVAASPTIVHAQDTPSTAPPQADDGPPADPATTEDPTKPVGDPAEAEDVPQDEVQTVPPDALDVLSIDHEALEPTEADIPPARLDEMPSLPDETVHAEEVLDEEELWEPEVALFAGVYFRDGVTPGGVIGARTRFVEYGPQTRRTEGRGSYRQRRVVGLFDGEIRIGTSDVGVDTLDLRLAPYAQRRERAAADGSEWGHTDSMILPLRISRSLEMDRRVALTLPSLGLDIYREIQVRDRISLVLNAQLRGLGFSHIQYQFAPRLHFNGMHLAGGDIEIGPRFQPSGTIGVRYVIGGAIDVHLGARDGKEVGPRFTAIGDVEARTGVGVDFGEHVSWDARAAFRGSIDSMRDNVSAWQVTTYVTGRF